LGQRAPRKSRQIATLRPPLSRIPSGDNDQVANRCSGVLGRTHLPRRSDARCPAGRPLSRPAASDWRAPRPIAGSARWRRSRTFSKKPAIAGHVRGDRPATTISRRRTPKRNPAATTRSGPSPRSSLCWRCLRAPKGARSPTRRTCTTRRWRRRWHVAGRANRTPAGSASKPPRGTAPLIAGSIRTRFTERRQSLMASAASDLRPAGGRKSDMGPMGNPRIAKKPAQASFIWSRRAGAH